MGLENGWARFQGGSDRVDGAVIQIGTDNKLPKRVYKGVPDRWRMAAWWTLAEEYANQEAKGKGKGKAKAEDLITNYRVSLSFLEDDWDTED
jgi:hypothetical protein